LRPRLAAELSLHLSPDGDPTMKSEMYRTRYPELNDDQNRTINAARELGFASCFPAFPNAHAQSRSTFRAAVKFLASRFAEHLHHADTHCWSCDEPRDYTKDLVCTHCGADVCPF
jgi:hypothetical protein